MADPNVIAGQMLNNDQAARAVVERYGSEERRQRLAAYYPAPLPNVVQEPLRHAAFQSELLAGLAEVVDTLLGQPATAKRGPGRPRKNTSQDATQDRPADTETGD